MSSPISLLSNSPSFAIIEESRPTPSPNSRAASQPPQSDEGLYSINAVTLSTPVDGNTLQKRNLKSPEFLEFSPLPSRSPEVRSTTDPLVEKIGKLESSINYLEYASRQLVKKVEFLQGALAAKGLIKEEVIVKPNLTKDKDA